jgi:hypothetical protein
MENSTMQLGTRPYEQRHQDIQFALLQKTFNQQLVGAPSLQKNLFANYDILKRDALQRPEGQEIYCGCMQLAKISSVAFEPASKRSKPRCDASTGDGRKAVRQSKRFKSHNNRSDEGLHRLKRLGTGLQ